MRFAAVVAVLAAAYAQPRMEHARVETRAVAGSLAATMQAILGAQSSPAWVGYWVPMAAGEHEMCCYNGNGRCGCALEGGTAAANAGGPGTVHLEGPRELVVLFRIANHAIEKARVYSGDCTLDAGDLPVVWITGVAPADSLRYLASLVPGEQRHSNVIAAMALHGDPGAIPAVIQLVRENANRRVRQQALFWLAHSNDPRGMQFIQSVLER